MKLGKGFYTSPRWSWEILDCAMPMTFDTYSNCAHQCVYCFAYFQKAMGTTKDEYLHHRVRSVNVNRIKKMFTEPDKYAGQFAFYIKQRMVLQWGGMSDPLDWYEQNFRKSLELLQFFKEIDYPISISTKGVWSVDDPEYQAVYKDAGNLQMKYSIITANPEYTDALEAGTPTSMERFTALKKLKDMGVAITTLRFRPFVIGASDGTMHKMFELAKWANVDSISTEFLCIERRASSIAMERYKKISEVVGYNVWDYYIENSQQKTGLMRLNYDLKRPYYEEMQRLSAHHNIPFFVSDAHHKERSASAGCCGLPEKGPLSNINRGQYAEAILIAKKHGKVFWSDIAPYAEGLKNIPFYRAENFNTSSSAVRAKRRFQNMYDYMHDIWNNPKQGMSPARYFGGVLVPGSTDENGDIVYIYNKPLVDEDIKVETVEQLKEHMELTEDKKLDGSDLAHVAFPIFAHWENENIINLLNGARVLYVIAVPAALYEQITNLYPNSDIIMLPESHNFEDGIINYSADEGYEKVWILKKDFTLPSGETVREFMSSVESNGDVSKDLITV